MEYWTIDEKTIIREFVLATGANQHIADEIASSRKFLGISKKLSMAYGWTMLCLLALLLFGAIEFPNAHSFISARWHISPDPILIDNQSFLFMLFLLFTFPLTLIIISNPLIYAYLIYTGNLSAYAADTALEIQKTKGATLRLIYFLVGRADKVENVNFFVLSHILLIRTQIIFIITLFILIPTLSFYLEAKFYSYVDEIGVHRVDLESPDGRLIHYWTESDLVLIGCVSGRRSDENIVYDVFFKNGDRFHLRHARPFEGDYLSALERVDSILARTQVRFERFKDQSGLPVLDRTCLRYFSRNGKGARLRRLLRIGEFPGDP